MSKLLHRSHIFPLLSVVCTIIFTAISFYYIAFFHVSPLSRDQWHMYAPYFDGGLLHAALTPMSTHRHLFPFLIFDMDMNLFGGRNHFLILFGSVFDGLVALLLVATLSKDDALSRFEKLVFCLLAVTTLAWLVNIAQLGWGFMSTQYYLAIFSYLFAVYSAYRYRHALSTRSLWLLTSIFCGVISTFSFGMGILVWPTLLYFLYLWRTPAKTVALVVFSFIACLAVFLFLPGGKSIEDALIFSPQSTITFLFQLAGGPIYYLLKSFRFIDTEKAKLVASILSVIATSLAILLLIHLLRLRRSLSLYLTLCCALMLVGLGTAALISFTRNPFFLDVWVDRYQLWATLFWLGFVPLCYMELDHIAWLKNNRLHLYIKKLLLSAILLFPILALPSQLDMGARLSEYKIRVQQALLVFQVGIPDKSSAEEALHWNWQNKLSPFFAVLHNLQIHKKNIYYHSLADTLGKPIQTVAIKQHEALTSLHIKKIDRITRADLLDITAIKNTEHFAEYVAPAADDIAAYQVKAYVTTARPWTQVLVTNPEGIVIGLGVFIKHSAFPRSHLKRINADYNLFAVIRNDGSEKCRFYFFDADNKDVAQVSDEITIYSRP